jgi:hypothetical protein
MLWMKPGATLVNIAHGGVMDDAALACGEVDPALARRQKSDVARPDPPRSVFGVTTSRVRLCALSATGNGYRESVAMLSAAGSKHE